MSQPTTVPDDIVDWFVGFVNGVNGKTVPLAYIEPLYEPPATRLYDEHGRQIVVVGGLKKSPMSGLAYSVPDGFLKLGDVVELPVTADYMHPSRTWEAQVTALETTYMGPLKSVLRRVD